METAKLKKFAQFARRSLIEQVCTKLKLVLAENSAARRENAEAIKKLDDAIHQHSKEQVIERVAYIWFNRFCALRFMDVNRYTRIGVVSSAEGQFQPEILAEAKMGHIDDEMVNDKTRQQIFALLDGKAPSRDPQGEAYRLLVVGACNHWHRAMPFLFERIDDYTELLMPDDLLSSNSILAATREAMTPDACQDVEVIGWLYQFYISEKKDEVFDGLKKNKKITPENIPAATQLFTPHWIVRYLVENSLGRLWMLNRPYSKLIEQMDYYIKPEQPETDFLRITKPEEIKICDPACGSAHMLTYAFDLLYAIYEEEGYEPAEIPEKILTYNLFGIEIDERAGELAAFALTMKARAKQRRFFNKGIKPNICVLENVQFNEGEIEEYMAFIGRDLFTTSLQTTLRQFEEADNFGSLIRPDVTDVDGMLRILESKNISGQLFISMTHQKVLQALRQADYLSAKYHVVIANPPYMGGKGMNGQLARFLSANYANFKSDLYSAFIVRNIVLTLNLGSLGFMTPFTWMTLSSQEQLRNEILTKVQMSSLVKPSYTAFFDSAIISVCAFTLVNKKPNSNVAIPFYDLGYLGSGSVQSDRFRRGLNGENSYAPSFRTYADFLNLPGRIFAYDMTDAQLTVFVNFERLGDWADIKLGLTTGSNETFVKRWPEVSFARLGLGFSSSNLALASKKKWFPYNKGGDFRRWYGNNENVINWAEDGRDVRNFGVEEGKIRSYLRNSNYYFRPSVTWSFVSSSNFGARYSAPGAVFDVGGSSAFTDFKLLHRLTAFLASRVAWEFLRKMNPTVNFQVGNIASLPISKTVLERVGNEVAIDAVNKCRSDWDAYETSWDFTILPILNLDYRQPTLKVTYQKLRAHWREMTLEMQRLEEDNNRIFIEAYGLQDELTPEVPLNEITLTCNPHYRYGKDKSEDELEALLLADTMRELISYAVGCMFGRYALEKPGLILANQGETLDDYLKLVPEPSFPADTDNVLPMLDGDWFTDDIAERFRKFLRVAFGEEHYEDNLKFIETALGKNGKPRDICDYFLKDFYSDHVRRYKKRPIYWLFSSPKGSFNALIYMHRYRPDTVSVVLNDYLREFRAKLASHKNHLEAVSISASASQGEKTKALKEIEKINKMIVEMEEYEREVLYPLATEQVEIDLDDGVKVNYLKLSAALKKIPGLDEKEME
jgi:hypothetical protein